MTPIARGFYGPAFAGREARRTEFHAYWLALNAALGDATEASYREVCGGWVNGWTAEEWAGEVEKERG